MVAAAALRVVLCAAQLKLATVGFTQVGLSEAQASFFTEHFSVHLASIDPNIRVATPKDMAALLGVERQKQLAGCSDAASSCMAELAGAMGADALVIGQVARVGKSYQINVKILAADGSKTLYLHSSKLLATEEELLEDLNAVAGDAIAQVRERLTEPTAVGSVSTAGRQGRSALKLLPAVVGLAGLVVGGVELANAQSRYRQLTDTSMWNSPGFSPAVLRDEGKQSLALGLTFGILGAIVAVGSVLWFLLT